MATSLPKRLTAHRPQRNIPRPQFFRLQRRADQAKLSRLLDANPQLKVIDTYESQLKEFFVLQYPWLHLNPAQRNQEFAPYRDSHYGRHEPWQVGTWVYLPWRHALLHLLDDDAYQQVRTARNRNLITAEEQQKYYHSTIGIAGLSVGNSVALALVLTGGGKHLRLADPDTLELTNLNRIRGSLTDLTEPKVYMTARQIYELDPYADLTLYPEGLTEENLNEFVAGLDVAVDEMDNLGMKVRLRQAASAQRIPVVMAADNGDGGILDVERHDLKRNIVPFHGRAGKNIAAQVVGKKLPLPVVGKIITEDLLGADVVQPRMQDSLLAIGRTLPTWPQLGGAALLNGVSVAAAIRRILTGQPVTSNRSLLTLEAWLEPKYHTAAQIKKRRQHTRRFLAAFRRQLQQALASA